VQRTPAHPSAGAAQPGAPRRADVREPPTNLPAVAPRATWSQPPSAMDMPRLPGRTRGLAAATGAGQNAAPGPS